VEKKGLISKDIRMLSWLHFHQFTWKEIGKLTSWLSLLLPCNRSCRDSPCVLDYGRYIAVSVYSESLRLVRIFRWLWCFW
jgi:hypothetical protein